MSNARQVVTRSPHRTVGRINRCSHIQDEPIEYESELEKKFVYLALLYPGTVRIKHQPFTLKLDDQVFKKYTPDFLVTLEDGSLAVVEIKPKSKVQKNIPRFDVISAALAAHQLPFLLITDQEIERAKQHKGAERILRYVNWHIAPDLKSRLMESLSSAGSLSINTAMETSQASIEDFLHLVARRQLVPSDLTMAPSTLLQLPNRESHHGILQLSKWFNTQVWRTPV